MSEGRDERSGVGGSANTQPRGPGSAANVAQVWLSHTPGEKIGGRYQLLRTLDQGGMGVVWVAHHLGLDIHVALKLLHPESDSPDAADRLVREAQAAARLDHPAIVDVLDVGRTAEGDPFLVMELLEGESLGDVLEREHTLDVVTAIRIIVPIADALAAMHAKAIVHRDVKPDNIFLAQGDAGRWQPKLIDFGLARVDDRSQRRITKPGMLIGTPAYLSPERMRGSDSDPADDVWSLCVMLYEMVTGELPFRGEHPLHLLLALTANTPRPLAFYGVVAPELWAILERGFRKRGQGWTSVGELGEALAGELRRRSVTHDISGMALRASGRDDAAPEVFNAVEAAPQERLPAHLVVTTRIHRPRAPEVAPPSPPAAAARAADPPAPAEEAVAEVAEVAPPAAAEAARMSSVPPPPPVDSLRAVWLLPALGLGLAALGALGWLFAGGADKGSPAPGATVDAGAPAAVRDTATAAPAGAMEAPASATTVPVRPAVPHGHGMKVVPAAAASTAVPAAPTVTAAPSVAPTATATAAAPAASEAAPAASSQIHDELRNPFR